MYMQTLDGSALAGIHYTKTKEEEKGGEVKIPTGETSVDVEIPILAVSENWDTKDDLWNGKRSFFLRAYDAKDVLFADDSGLFPHHQSIRFPLTEIPCPIKDRKEPQSIYSHTL